MWWWFWWWLAFTILFVLIPLSYLWAYRGWGPPYYRRDRVRPVDPIEREELLAAEEAELQGWGWATLAIWWVLFLIALAWLIIAMATATAT